MMSPTPATTTPVTAAAATVSIAVTSEQVTHSSRPLEGGSPTAATRAGGHALTREVRHVPHQEGEESGGGEEEEGTGGHPFAHIDQMMYLEQCSPDQVRAHPAFEHFSEQEREVVVRHYQALSKDELGQIKLAYLASYLTALAESATYNLVEIGNIVVMGNLVGLHRLTGCESMYEWARTALHIDKSLLSLAIAKYNAWLYIRDYGYGVESLVGASETHVQAIRDLSRDIHRQHEEIRRRKLHERLTTTTVASPSSSSPLLPEYEEEEEEGAPSGRGSLLFDQEDLLLLEEDAPNSDDDNGDHHHRTDDTPALSLLQQQTAGTPVIDQAALNAEVAQEYQAIAHAEIGRILTLSPEDLSEERQLASGSIMRPHLCLSVIYDPRTGNLEGIDPRTGARTGAIYGHLEEAHLRGLAKGQISLSFRLKLPESIAARMKPTLSTKELGTTILEHCPPSSEDEEDEEGGSGEKGRGGGGEEEELID